MEYMGKINDDVVAKLKEYEKHKRKANK